ncbi:STAS domain-containing protein [Pseudonocardia charpentierae]|uniref:STAS domain-containing protein n=1 Tax=Pseudonocardia charpentierae TaxID=3075545 RepID=UPI00288A3B39|nr:STAS domain-containing protein [Pseudonocardia sp. DSM 45834]
MTPGQPANDHPAGWSWSTEPLPTRHGIIVVLRLGGEIDMLNQPELQTALTDTLTGRPHHLVVDLAAVTFCWVQGLVLLADTAEIATGNGTGYALSGLPAPIRRHVTLLWGDAFPTTYRTTAIAVSTIRADHTR